MVLTRTLFSICGLCERKNLNSKIRLFDEWIESDLMRTDQTQRQEFAEAMVEARTTGVQSMLSMPDPAITIDDAMDYQTAVFQAYGFKTVGWKVGATNATAQAGFGLDGPFYGPIVEAVVMRSGSNLQKTPCVGAVE
ncbi:MAG: hypothetical protein AAFO98_14815, partial [Pseudomonadota bacterium]